ncbi:PQQ-binding-like beta-propeller repeat protein [Pontibacter sp. SGAir0037]|uniref:outer membrane protein assembly factor BamB family protein n=1 Tax=Pontibacter sp. SGAir0037 TaxID=2571030 RepID=UPI00143D80C2|nr:PQQ-binding-like beta-propeller repeat protein [Pontibacter sp. SGAir0037]
MEKVKVMLLSVLLSLIAFSCKDDDLGDLVPPEVVFNYTPATPVEGQEVLFYADRAVGSGEVSTWNWNFGDAKGSTSNKRNPYFTYEAAGTYNVTLTVTNAAGATHQVSNQVVIAPKPKELVASIVWEFNNNTAVTAINEGSSSPVIGDDGTIYYLESRFGNNGKVVAVTDQGQTAQLKWAREVGHYIANAPSIGPDGNIYVNTWDNAKAIQKLNGQDGTVMWTGGGSGVLGASNTTPAIDSQGNIYHGSRFTAPNGGFFSFSPTGEKRWQIIGVGAFYTAPVLSPDEKTVYVLNTNEGKLWAVNTADGTSKWTESVGMGSGTHGSSLSMDADGTIYYTTNAHVVAITDNGTTGAVKWSATVTGAAQSGVVIGANGDLYTGSAAGLVALEPANGNVKWTYNLTTTESVPAVDKNGYIYIGSADGKLVVVSSEGLLAKEFPLGTGAVNSPTIANDGTVYVEALAGSNIKLYKIAVEESGPADSPWPMKGRNVKNTAQTK